MSAMTTQDTGELPAHEVFGPQGTYVVALIERARRLTPDEASALDTARDATLVGAWTTAWRAARAAPPRAAELNAAWDAAGHAAGHAACALVVRDLITTNCYDALTRPWRTVIGPIHPDDPDIGRAAR